MERLYALAEDPRYAGNLIRHIEANSKYTQALWAVLGIAYITVGAAPSGRGQ